MALKIRALTSEDLSEVQELHEKFFSNLEFPDFYNMLNAFIIEDENEEIILAGGVQPIGEAVLVTNKDKNRTKIGRALVEAQRCAMYTCGLFNIRELHAFVQDTKYANHLIQHGFEERKATVLRITL